MGYVNVISRFQRMEEKAKILKKIFSIIRALGGEVDSVVLLNSFEEFGIERDAFFFYPQSNGIVIDASDEKYDMMLEAIKKSDADVFFFHFQNELYCSGNRIERLFDAIGNRKSYCMVWEFNMITDFPQTWEVIQNRATKICLMSEIGLEYIKQTPNITVMESPNVCLPEVNANKEEVRKELGITTPYVMLMFALPCPRQNIEFAVKLTERLKDVTFVYVTGLFKEEFYASYLSGLETYANSKGFSERLKILRGWKSFDELARVFSIADIALAPYTVFSGFDIGSSSIMYLLSAGKCIIGSPKKIFQLFETKYKCMVTVKTSIGYGCNSNENLDEFESLIRFYLSHPEERKEIEKNGREFAYTHSWKEFAKKIISDLQ